MNKLTFILLTLVLSQLAFATRESDFLVNTLLSRQENSVVRSTAAKALSQFATDSRVIRALLVVVKDQSQESEVRIEAVKALTDEAMNLRTGRELILQYSRETDMRFKVWIVKSLYQGAEQLEVRTFLERILMQESHDELQKAAAFALMLPVLSPNTSRLFVQRLQDRRTSDDVKVEMLKSLYWNQQRNIHDLLVYLVSDRNESTTVRVAALRVLQNNIHDASGRMNFLTLLASNDSSVEVRKAALFALRPRLEESDMAWFHLTKNPYSNLKRNPLED